MVMSLGLFLQPLPWKKVLGGGIIEAISTAAQALKGSMTTPWRREVTQLKGAVKEKLVRAPCRSPAPAVGLISLSIF